MKPQKRSSKCEIVNLSISFNLLDPHQKRLFEHAREFVNFSAAAKRWLEHSLSGSERYEHQKLVLGVSDPHGFHSLMSEKEQEEHFDPAVSLL